MSALTIRRPDLELPDEADPNWTPSRPEFACAANSVSLLMPYMEPYFVRSIAAVIDRLEGDEAERARSYIGQEAEHHRYHRRYNRLLRQHYRGLGPVERTAEWVYRQLGRRRSDGFNLAFTAASETIAYSAARWAADRRQDLFVGADPRLSELFVWHLAEEVEHKASAWDVHRATGGTRWTYLLAGLVSLMLVASFVVAGTTVMLAGQRRLLHPLSWIRLGGWGVTFAFELVSNLVVSLLPGHHPDRFVDPVWYDVWLAEHDLDTRSGTDRGPTSEGGGDAIEDGPRG